MYDLHWVSRILEGIMNITSTTIVEWITHDQKMKMDSKIQPFNNDRIFSDEERKYIWGVADYFNLKLINVPSC